MHVAMDLLCRLQAKILVPVAGCSRPFQRSRATGGRGAQVQKSHGRPIPGMPALLPPQIRGRGIKLPPHAPRTSPMLPARGPRLATRAPITTWHGCACECSPSPSHPRLRRLCLPVHLQTCHGFWQSCCCHWLVFRSLLPCFALTIDSPC